MIRVPEDFHAWLRVEAARRGCSIAELLIALASKAERGAPWKRKPKKR